MALIEIDKQTFFAEGTLVANNATRDVGTTQSNMSATATIVVAPTATKVSHVKVNQINGVGTISARPIRVQHTKVDAMSGSASISSRNFIVVKHLGSPLVQMGGATITLVSDSWKYMTVRGKLEGSAKLDVFHYEDRNILQDISDYLPKYYSDSIEASAITHTTASEFIRLNAYALDVLAQFYPQTATWGLERWEKSFNIIVDHSRPIEERREEVIERIRGFYEVTLEILQNEAEKFYPVLITHLPRDLSITIRVMDKSVGNDSNNSKYRKFVSKMEALVPCHLELVIVSSKTTWGELKERRILWEQMRNFTWNEIKDAPL